MKRKLSPTKVRQMLDRLASEGCGCPPWCRCLLCRVQRIVQTESTRTKENEWESPTKTTRLIDWRGGAIEFTKDGREHLAAPPWYAIEATRLDGRKPWHLWLDYCGPPELFLTRKVAALRAKDFRKQYGRGKAGYQSVRIVRVVPVPDKRR